MTKTYLASDFHLWHNPLHWETPIWETRGFSSAEEFTRFAIEETLDTLKAGDRFLFCGDLAMNAKDEDVSEFLHNLDKTGAKTTYLWGNHETNVRRILKKGFRSINIRFRDYFDGSIAPEGQRKYNVCAMHYPISSWNKMAHGRPMIHGHTHGGHPNSQASDIKGKILDVGVENALADSGGKSVLFTLDRVKKIIDNKQFASKDAHHTPELEGKGVSK